MERRRIHAWQGDDEEEQGDEDQPVQRKIAQIDRPPGPGIDREEPRLRIEKVAVAAQEADRRRRRIDLRRLPGSFRLCASTELLDHAGEPLRVTLNPRRQPAADVAASGDRGQEVDLLEKPGPRERLQYAERE